MILIKRLIMKRLEWIRITYLLLIVQTWMYSDSFGYGNLHAFSIQTTTKKYAVILRCVSLCELYDVS